MRYFPQNAPFWSECQTHIGNLFLVFLLSCLVQSQFYESLFGFGCERSGSDWLILQIEQWTTRYRVLSSCILCPLRFHINILWCVYIVTRKKELKILVCMLARETTNNPTQLESDASQIATICFTEQVTPCIRSPIMESIFNYSKPHQPMSKRMQWGPACAPIRGVAYAQGEWTAVGHGWRQNCIAQTYWARERAKKR